MHAAQRGDYGSLVLSAIFLVFGLVFLLNVGDIARTLAQRVVDRSPRQAKLGVTVGYRIYRVMGLYAVAIAVALVLFT
ncbi:MAG TPA: hypothetical protein VJ851_05135 [Jatrophihabitans sp.]|nr:hypothetical protein [Jatrophihabitans sp.]